MLGSTSWYLVTIIFLVNVIATQVPFHSSQAEWQPATLNDEHLGDWSLDTAPNSNSTDHLVFETVHSLLQRWPNTRMRNGECRIRLSGHLGNTSFVCRSRHSARNYSKGNTFIPWDVS